MKAKSNGYRTLVWLSVAISFILIGYPILIIFVRSFSGGGFTLNNYIEVFTNPKNLVALRNSLFLSVTGTLSSAIIGCFMAWIMSRTKVHFQKLIDALMRVHFFIPPFISALAGEQILGPVVVVNKLYIEISGA